jgi:hypothetical protein
VLLVVVMKRSRRGVDGDGAGELRSALGEEREFEGFVLRRELVALLMVARVRVRVRVREAGETVEEEIGGLGVVLAESEVLGFMRMMMMMMMWCFVETGDGGGSVWAEVKVVMEWRQLSE